VHLLSELPTALGDQFIAATSITAHNCTAQAYSAPVSVGAGSGGGAGVSSEAASEAVSEGALMSSELPSSSNMSP
jgi:hypothetical protein